MRQHKVSAASRLQEEVKPLKATKQEYITMLRNMAYGAGVDIDERALKRSRKDELSAVVNAMTSFVSRGSLQAMLGQTFNGKRDLYENFGWKKTLKFADYLNMYERNGIAARVVDIKADETWKKFPILHDGRSKADYKDSTEFLKAWNMLVQDMNLQNVFYELDVALGISRFSVIVIGVKGDTDYSKPLEPNGKKEIAFLRVLDEGMVEMSTTITDVYNPRYGKPETYRCKFEEDGVSVPVHWTRVVHCKGMGGRSNVYGNPGLMRSYNNLADLEKVVGSSSEAFWQHIRRTLVLMANEGSQLPQEGDPAYPKMMEQVDNLRYQLDNVIRLRNMQIEKLGSDAVDGANQHNLLISDIAGTEGIPQRILLGSERGELASTTDVGNLQSMIGARQVKLCQVWVREFVTHLYKYGFIPAPSTGRFDVEWESLFDMTPTEKVDLGAKKIDLLDKATGGAIDTERTAVEKILEESLDGYAPTEEGTAPKKPIEPTEGSDQEEQFSVLADERIAAGGLDTVTVTTGK